MRKLRFPVLLLTFSLLLVSAGFLLLGAQAFTTFLPPRTAVVNSSQIFIDYKKRVDKEAELKTAIEGVVSKLSAAKDQYAIKQEQLKSIKRDSPAYLRAITTMIELEQKIAAVQKTRLTIYEERANKPTAEIREEISREIKIVAASKELDLVLERSIRTKLLPQAPEFVWAIVHYSKPEYDITKEVTDRLNRRYKRPGG
tara:strand:+ start:942 stop:1538 length:597 start_codon:yes stop_codon:yes gene_type:complete